MEEAEVRAAPQKSDRFCAEQQLTRKSLAADKIPPPEIVQIGVPVRERGCCAELTTIMDAFDIAIRDRRTAVLAENTRRLVQEAASADDDLDEMDIRHANN